MNSGGKLLIPFWEKRIEEETGLFSKTNVRKGLFYLKITFYSLSGFMILWSFIQSFFIPWNNFGSSSTTDNTENRNDPLLNYSPLVFGYPLAVFAYPVSRMFIKLIWIFQDKFSVLKYTGLPVIFSMLIIMFYMRFITFWPTLRSSIYQEKQLLHQPGIDNISAKYERYDPSDREMKIKKHQEITAYNKKHGLKPFAALENFFINTPIFLIVFRLITVATPVKSAKLFDIWEFSKIPSSEVFNDFLDNGYKYYFLCLVIIPINFFSQKLATWLSGIRNPSTKRKVISKNSPAYKMQNVQKLMSIVFLLFTFFWSTGLAIYYFFNSIFTIFQNLLIHWVLVNRKASQNSAKVKLQKLGIDA